MTLKSRLRRLNRELRPHVCPECQDRRGRVVLVVNRRSADGTIATENDGPTPCSRCGEVPEQVVGIVEEIVYARSDAEEHLGSVR